jgi:aldehyde:ferredoxin oxidoreductase
MVKGYCGRIMHIDLTQKDFFIEQPSDEFYRTYMGGSCMGSYYVAKEVKPDIDALDPKNVLVFSTGPATGAMINGASRHCVTSKSPLTGTLGCSEAGGFWGPELKFAGYDALVITGKAPHPVYIWINNNKCEIKDARHLWGKVTGDAYDDIKEELGDNRIKISLIGPGGENMVRFACIANDLKHFNGRNGLGAVMGSKNLKAIAVRGTNPVDFYNREAIIEMAKSGNKIVRDSFGWLHDTGTTGGVKPQNDAGGLPAYNFSSGTFKGTVNITGEKMRDTISKKAEGCWSCSARCKRVVEVQGPVNVNPRYGGPEYETLGMVGSNLGIDDLVAIAKANELCNKYTLDTISLGGVLSFIMECFEKKVVSTKNTGGVSFEYGSADTLINSVEMIAKRQGFGNILAEGSKKAAEYLGSDTIKLAVQCKGQEFPAHMPRVKSSLALIYAVNPFGADHQSSLHDSMIESEPIPGTLRSLGLNKAAKSNVLNFEKVKLAAYTQKATSLLDSLSLCQFCFGFWSAYNFDHVVQLVNCATGWNTNLWELMLVGERRINLMRAYNASMGFTKNDDILPDKMFKGLEGGASAGFKINKDDFENAKNDYYEMMGWDINSGNPTKNKLKELDLEWLSN